MKKLYFLDEDNSAINCPYCEQEKGHETYRRCTVCGVVWESKEDHELIIALLEARELYAEAKNRITEAEKIIQYAQNSIDIKTKKLAQDYLRIHGNN